MERWKNVRGFEQSYLISDHGRVYSLHRKRMKVIHLNQFGYKKVQLILKNHNHTVFVHRLVAESFIKRVPEKNEVNHVDGNKLNNHFSNLEWCNRSENVRHAFKLGLNKGCPKGKRIKKAKIGI